MLDVKLKNSAETRIKIAETGKNLKEFAESVEISPTYLTQILREHRRPSPTVAYKIANGLEVDINDIFLISNVAKLHPVKTN